MSHSLIFKRQYQQKHQDEEITKNSKINNLYNFVHYCAAISYLSPLLRFPVSLSIAHFCTS